MLCMVAWVSWGRNLSHGDVELVGRGKDPLSARTRQA